MELQKFGRSHNEKMSSREIAQLTGKLHKNVLQDCDKLNENYRNMGLAEISAGAFTHPSTGKQQHREMHLSKIQTMDLMTGYDVRLRIKVNRRWEELENRNPAKEISKIDLARMVIESEEENQRLQIQLQEQAPKVLFTEAVMGSTTSCLIGELAKLIAQNGYEIGEKRLFKWLRENNYLGTKGERYNIPMQKYIEQGLFELKKGTRSGNGGVMHQTITPKVTGKGQVYFVNKFLKVA